MRTKYLKKFIRRPSRYFSDTEGVAAIEFALISVAFLGLLFSVVEFSRYLWAWNNLQYSAETAGRYILVNQAATDNEIENVVLDLLKGYEITENNPTIAVNRFTVSGINFVEIQTVYQFQPIMPLLPAALLDIDIQASSLTSIE